MRFLAIVLFALIAISSVQAQGVTQNETFRKCLGESFADGGLNCNKAADKNSCLSSRVEVEDKCMQSDANKPLCNPLTQTDYSIYVKCIKGCYSKATDPDAKQYYNKTGDCLSGSISGFVALVLFSLFALFF